MNSTNVKQLADRFAALHDELEPLLRRYDEDMKRLEKESRDAKGQKKKEVKQKIERRREQCLKDLRGTDVPGSEVPVFADKAAVWFSEAWPRQEDARFYYMRIAAELSSKNGGLRLPEILNLDPWPPKLFHDNWLAIDVSFTLQTPWYSKDDRPFHVLDNPVRKDRVFGVPFMSAASWKGLLRWAMGMTTGLIGPERVEDKEARESAEATIIHLFGNEKGESEDFQRGALAFYPTWFSRVAFEVTNPHSRKTRAGTQPIYYEVVPPGTEGTLRLLYAPLPGQAARDGVEPRDALGKLLEAIEKLLTTYGFSAKRTAGWGLASINEWILRGSATSKQGSRQDVAGALDQLLEPKG